MKKVYSGFSIFICLSFLATVSSCTADAPFESNEGSVITTAKKALLHYNAEEAEQITLNSEDADGAANSLSSYSTQTEGEQIIDPDWKKLITGFIDSERVTD
ncbi:hypothetical protein [Flavobacterium granuli]|uniref:Uncharacterized protein n=1 Tax=Flavobacterium granuli TaxID=280093 RepID=A0A1M5TZA7_9FLAO|nr:hypothetical protein [Flavobacterium granuli]PRZ22913.1 hypothetical protein BC624_106163 [Flavobacterium granuli]SHH55950.1 hypothetical protein SAMN05443373_11644 [Flavobacterium granuli]